MNFDTHTHTHTHTVIWCAVHMSVFKNIKVALRLIFSRQLILYPLCFITAEDHTATKEVILSYFCLHLMNVASFARHRPFVMFLL